MSDYLKQKVLRIPVSIDDEIFDKTDRDDLDMDYYYPELFSYNKAGKFQLAPTENLFIDYVLESEYDCNYGEYGKTRALYQVEKEKYQETFNQIIPNCDMDKVRLVEYCWYNSTDAPSYYDETNDDFYKEI